ncbi:MAG: hypothetical protein P1P69_06405 [Methanosarcinaceae archaeon]|nr:hypothetical protein [Methanosarcinaceae archaeon]MDF1534117.1 hypothetical protein [Methanosarcinaceae archaeon]
MELVNILKVNGVQWTQNTSNLIQTLKKNIVIRRSMRHVLCMKSSVTCLVDAATELLSKKVIPEYVI